MGRRRAPGPTRVCLEVGSTWVFATAFDWPGWCRRARSEGEALECLLGYNDRYRIVVGKEFDPGPIEMVGRSDGNRTTDFGARFDTTGRLDGAPRRSGPTSGSVCPAVARATPPCLSCVCTD